MWKQFGQNEKSEKKKEYEGMTVQTGIINTKIYIQFSTKNIYKMIQEKNRFQHKYTPPVEKKIKQKPQKTKTKTNTTKPFDEDMTVCFSILSLLPELTRNF